MDEKKHILIVEDNEVTLYKIKAILIRLGYVVIAFDRPLTALEWLKTAKPLPDLIISDVVMPDMNGYEFIKRVRSEMQTRKTPIILLSSQADLKDRLAGLEAGADDYLSKTISPDELELRVKALLTRAQETTVPITQAVAKTFSVFSLRGGVGTTCIAINLALAIAQLWGIETCLWDMALSNGQCALMLNLKPKLSLTALGGWNEATLDEAMLRSMLLQHETGIKLLPAPDSFEEAELITPAIVDLVWSPLQTIAPYMIVDAGNHFSEPVIPVLERSDAILLVLAPELASVNAAYQALRIFSELGFENEKVHLVLNNIFPSSTLLPQKISAGLKKEIFAELEYDSQNFVRSINQGKPYLMIAPKSAVSLSIAKMAYKLTVTEKKA